MLTIDIDRVTTRYRVPVTAAGERLRLQRIVDDALTRALEYEVERRGIDPESYVCIDTVRTVVPVRLREPDGALTGAVGHAIAAAIHEALDDSAASVVRYSSRAHVLADVAASALAGDFTRSWAWTQIGVWRSDGALRADAAANLVLRTLANEAQYAVGVLAYLARTHADRLHTLAARATPRAWELLAQSALAAARGDTLRIASVRRIDTHRGTGPAPTAVTAGVATHIAARSDIVRASIDAWPGLAGPTREAIAILALLEVEPARAQGAEPAAAVLTTIERRIREDSVPGDELRLTRSSDTLAPGRGSDRPPTSASRDGSPSPDAALDSHDMTRRGQNDAAARAPRTEAAAESSPSAARATDHSRTSEPVALPVEVRQRARTRHGGLLYLLNLLPHAGIVHAIERDERWATRGMRWVLHQAAMALVDLEPDDPAALAFAGLLPDVPPPSTLQDPPTDAERAALHALATTIVAALRDRLGRTAGANAQSDAALVHETCARHAEIVAEPAWIEARFALEDVSIDIRRAALDINPEWVPWLGIVLRFVYE